MSETPVLALTWVAGILLGATFFGGLWWTVRKGVSSSQPALWFLASLVLRTSVTLAGFYFVAGGQWKRLLSSLLGFVTASLLVTRWTRAAGDDPRRPGKEPGHAAYPR